MRIVIATGIYPPDVGGPALYARGVEESLASMGHAPVLVLFGNLKRFPSGVRHVFYFFRLYRAAKDSSAIFAFDTFSTGVAAALVGRLRSIPVVLRIGGDFVWESFVARTKEPVPLPDFYSIKRNWGLKERVSFWLVRWMLKEADLAFNTPWLQQIWQAPYGIDPGHSHVVENVFGERLESLPADNAVLLYGRKIPVKNSEAFKRAFSKVAENSGLILEEGSIPHEKFLERVRRAYAVAIPSISEVAPNTVIDAIRCGKPFLLSKYSGYSRRFSDLGIIIDPLSEEDMARGIEQLADPNEYEKMRRKIGEYSLSRDYADVTRELLKIAGL